MQAGCTPFVLPRRRRRRQGGWNLSSRPSSKTLRGNAAPTPAARSLAKEEVTQVDLSRAPPSDFAAFQANCADLIHFSAPSASRDNFRAHKGRPKGSNFVCEVPARRRPLRPRRNLSRAASSRNPHLVKRGTHSPL
jgi:hypothetical protein